MNAMSSRRGDRRNGFQFRLPRLCRNHSAEVQWRRTLGRGREVGAGPGNPVRQRDTLRCYRASVGQNLDSGRSRFGQAHRIGRVELGAGRERIAVGTLDHEQHHGPLPAADHAETATASLRGLPRLHIFPPHPVFPFKPQPGINHEGTRIYTNGSASVSSVLSCSTSCCNSRDFSK